MHCFEFPFGTSVLLEKKEEDDKEEEDNRKGGRGRGRARARGSFFGTLGRAGAEVERT